MPSALTYPGVYVEEIPSGVRTITGVATSITAFIGRAKRGPVNEATTINSFGDYERIFGGLWAESTMSFAVRDFYLNGGSQAVIVRLFNPIFANEDERKAASDAAKEKAQPAAEAVGDAASAAVAAANTPQEVADAASEAVDAATGDVAKAAATYVADAASDAVTEDSTPQDIADAAAAAVSEAVAAAVNAAAPVTKAQLTVGDAGGELKLEAANQGKWGNKLRARIDHDVVGDDAANIFNLSIKDTGTGQVELFRNVSVQSDHLRRVDKVLEQQSDLVRTVRLLPGNRPAENGTVGAGADPFGDATVTVSASDGDALTSSNYTGSPDRKEGLYALEQVDLFNLLCIPPFSSTQDVNPASFWDTAAQYCEKRRAMLIVDSPGDWTNKKAAIEGIPALGTRHKNAAVFFPRLMQPNPNHDNRLEEFAPCGAVAGIMARTDTQRGVWKAPAGLDAILRGVPKLKVPLTDAENGELNPLGINCLRTRPAAGRVIWGARTLQGDDRFASEWKYIPVRRTALYIEESLYRGTQWVVFEPNDEPLWAQIRLNVGAFMHNLFRQGAFQGSSPKEAYFVKCDKETTPQNDIDRGIVNILVGFAPLKPAEFVVIKLQQIAGELEV